MIPKHFIKLIERYEKLLPSIIYSEDTSLAWDSQYQRRETAKLFVIEDLEQEVRLLEMLRGEGLYTYSMVSKMYITIDQRMEEIKESIRQIKLD